MKRIQGSALLHVIVVGLIITLTTISLILYAYINRSQFNMYLLNAKLRSNLSSALLLAASSNVYDQTIYDDLYDTNEDSVKWIKKGWGYLSVISASAFRGDRTREASGFYTCVKDPFRKIDFFLMDEGTPFYVGDGTLLRGECYVPLAKVSYRGEKSSLSDIIGFASLHISMAKLPELDQSKIEKLYAQMVNSLSLDSIMDFSAIEKEDSLKNIFSNRTLRIESNSVITLLHHYDGNIIIESKKQINVSSGCSLTDVILVAPKIIVADTFSGNAQLFSDTILIGKNCNLKYPTVLSTLNKVDQHSYIHIQRGSVLYGAVMMFGPDRSLSGKHNYAFLDSVDIFGDLFIDGSLEMVGNVNGSIVCRNIFSRESGTIINNYMANTKFAPSTFPGRECSLIPYKLAGRSASVKWIAK